MNLGIDVFLNSKSHIDELIGKRVALLAHPASVNAQLKHSIDLLWACEPINLVCAFGPQHGITGDKQYNMDESEDFIDPKYNIPIYSLYGEHRRPTAKMMESFDVLLFDLQDVGCRIYTYVASLIYMIEACAQSNKPIWILDRPNPVGRKVEGSYLRPEWKSFVGEVELPMRHGLTLAELALWYKETQKLDVEINVIKMQGYDPQKISESPVPWVNPSPQIPSLKTCRVYNGTVLLEGTHWSEGRGTTLPFELLGAPEFPAEALVKQLYALKPEWVEGCKLRPCYFTPTFNKHTSQLCSGLQIHTDDIIFEDHKFNPYRLMGLIFKAYKKISPQGATLWSQFHYEYEKDRRPIDLLSGSEYFANWVDDSEATPEDLEGYLHPDEARWTQERIPFLLY